MHLLLIEDDLDLGTALQRALMGHGYTCTWVRSVKDARLQVQAFERFACLVLDLGLPDGEGIELLRAWRRGGVDVPVIVLTARDALASKVSGLDAGADDYVIKPVAPEELASRIRAVTRRAAGQSSSAWSFGSMRIHIGRQEVSQNDVPVPLSPKEFQIIEALARHAGQVVTKHRMAELLQPHGDPLAFSTLDWHIHNLRRKLGAGTIQTVRGVGYFLGE